MRGKLVVGNWKMNGGLASNARLLDRLASEWQPSEGRSPAVCVPFPYLGQAQAALASTRIAWGAQDVSEHASGAYTGEVAAGMLVEFGCRYALAGHSEPICYVNRSFLATAVPQFLTAMHSTPASRRSCAWVKRSMSATPERRKPW